MPTPISEAMWGYLAGMIDGEGSIMLSILRGRKDNPTWFYYEPKLVVYGTHKESITSISNDFNGRLCKHSNRGYGTLENKKLLYESRWQSQDIIIEILQNIIPYLRIKGPQAKLLLEYCESRKARIRHKAPLSDREKEIYFLIRAENQKGGHGGKHESVTSGQSNEK